MLDEEEQNIEFPKFWDFFFFKGGLETIPYKAQTTKDKRCIWIGGSPAAEKIMECKAGEWNQ